MKKEVKTIVYDNDLKIEGYRFEGVVQSFPNHFHEYYVIGLVEGGRRYLSCKNKDYALSMGDIVIFNPRDNHTCTQSDNGTLDYRGLNITEEVMFSLVKEITGKEGLPGFFENVIYNEEANYYLRTLHELIMKESVEFEKEENLLLLMEFLIQNYSKPFEACVPECREEVEKACSFMEEHFTQKICLDHICQHVGLSKSTLLRAFTKSRGVTPYRYLETIRINEAKKLLEKGVTPIMAAMQTGFSDQSHFTNYFTSFIGLSPGVYREIFQKKDIKL